MTKLLTLTGLVALLLLSSSVVRTNNTETASPAESLYRTQNVIVLIIDGPRFSETFGDSTCQYIPNLSKELAPQGVLFTNFRNNGTTNTNSGHTAITTGVYQNIKNNGSELPKYPSFFQYYLKEKKVSKEKAWIVSSKGKLNILANARLKAESFVQGHIAERGCGPAWQGGRKDPLKGVVDPGFHCRIGRAGINLPTGEP